MWMVWAALTGCDHGVDFATFVESGAVPDEFETGDGTADCIVFYEGPVLLTHARVTCQDDDLLLWFQTEGWTSGGRVFVEATERDAPHWAEEHELESTRHDACGAWDEIQADVHAGVRTDQYIPDVTSAFACSDPNQNVLTYAAQIDDADGNYADCVVFGADPAALLAGGERVIDPSFDSTRCVVGELAR